MGNSQTSPQPPKSVVWLLPTQAPISEQCGVGGWRGGGSKLAACYLPRDMSSLFPRPLPKGAVSQVFWRFEEGDSELKSVWERLPGLKGF